MLLVNSISVTVFGKAMYNAVTWINMTYLHNKKL